MFLRCIFAHVCGPDYSLELIMFGFCFVQTGPCGKTNLMVYKAYRCDITCMIITDLVLLSFSYIII